MPTTIEIAVAAAGGGFLLAALFWRMRSRRRALARVRRGLLDPEPAARQAAVLIAADQGLARHVNALLERARQEPDERVLATLAEVVLRNQWEPASDQRLVELRLWAQARASQFDGNADGTHQPRVRAARASSAETDATEPSGLARAGLLPTALANGHGNGNGSVPAAAPNGADEAHRYTPLHNLSGPNGGHRHESRGLTAIVTGAGGPAGITVIRALKAAGHRVIGVDVDGMAAGLRFADEAALVPHGSDASFPEAVCELAAGGADVLLSTVSEELATLALAGEELAAAGLAAWLPLPDAVDACVDKWRFAGLLRASGLPGPATGLGTGDGIPGSWVVKPRFGRGSRGVYFADRPSELEWALKQVPEPIVQTRLAGREFTVDALVERDGRLAGAVPRWRLETTAGISTRGRTFRDDDLVEAVGTVLTAAGLTGPANVQGFMSASGVPSFVEVNPRFSGGLALSLAAGSELVGEYLRGIVGEAVRPERLTYRPGVRMIRYFGEILE